MKLWLISQNVNNGYDTYDAAVVAAETPEEAKNTEVGWADSWAPPDYVIVQYLGEARDRHPAGIILSSFNAG